MNYKDSIICQKIPEVDTYSKMCSDLLRENTWSEVAIDLTQSITDYKNETDNVDALIITLEIFFILESSIIKVANEPISKFAAGINSADYSEFLHLYVLNEFTHAKFYRNLYTQIVAHDQVVDEEHIKTLYEKYENIECFMRRVSDISDTMSRENMDYIDFINLSCMEGIKFMSAFNNIFYYARDGKYQAVGEGNRWVSIDEFIHSLNHLFTANYLRKLAGVTDKSFLKLVNLTVSQYVADEKEFSKEMYPEINLEHMYGYINWLGLKIINNSLEMMGRSKISSNSATLPPYMKNLVLENKEALHETINTNYVKSNRINTDLSMLDIAPKSYSFE